MFKRFCCALLCAIYMLLFGGVSVSATDKNVHHIKDGMSFMLLDTHPEDTFYLTGDVYVSGNISMMCSTPDKPFSGTLDGNGYRIIFLDVKSDSDEVALFGYLTGTVKSVRFTDASISTTADTEKIAGIALYNKGSIIDCSFDGYIKSAGKPVYGRGIAYSNTGTISGCTDYTKKNTVDESSSAVSSLSGTQSNTETSVPETTTSSDFVSSNKKPTFELQLENTSSVDEKADEKTSEDETSDERPNAEKYFNEKEYEPYKKFDKKFMYFVSGIAIVGCLVFAGICIHREVKLTRVEKKKKDE